MGIVQEGAAQKKKKLVFPISMYDSDNGSEITNKYGFYSFFLIVLKNKSISYYDLA